MLSSVPAVPLCLERMCVDWSWLTALWSHRHLATNTLRTIDRVYCNADIQMLSDLQPVAVIHGTADQPPGKSDHWPIRVTWLSSRSSASGHGLPRYIMRHPKFKTLLLYTAGTGGNHRAYELAVLIGGIQNMFGLCC
eukprot:1362720-Amphidinium_carterae.1